MNKLKWYVRNTKKMKQKREWVSNNVNFNIFRCIKCRNYMLKLSYLNGKNFFYKNKGKKRWLSDSIRIYEKIS